MKKLTNYIFLIDTIIFGTSAYFIANIINIKLESIIALSLALWIVISFVLFSKDFYNLKKIYFEPKHIYSLSEGILLSYVISFVLLMFLGFETELWHFLMILSAVIALSLIIFRAIFAVFFKNMVSIQNLIIVGANSAGEKVAKEILDRTQLKLNIVGFIDNDDKKISTEIEGIKVLGKTSDLKKIVKGKNIEIIIDATKDNIDNDVSLDISELTPYKISIYKMPYFYEEIAKKIPVQEISPNWFLYNFKNIKNPILNFLKRTFDIIAASIILLVTLPIEIVIAISIKLADGGPIFYLQERVGKNGKTFKMIKLRTMIEAAENDGAVWAVNNNKDPRVTHIGRFARKTRFDEIPQMINIIKGEMSVVGPRPERPEFIEMLEKEIPYYSRRHWVKPGWTGWAQIMYRYGASVEDAMEKLRYDFYYIKHYNIFVDFAILLKAVAMALSGRHG